MKLSSSIRLAQRVAPSTRTGTASRNRPSVATRVATGPSPKTSSPQLPVDTPYSPASFMKHWEGLRAEESYWIDEIEGEIPADFEGSFFRAGPGLTEIGGAKMHPFDGHGAIARIGVKAGKAHFNVKFVKTEAYQEEVLEKQAITYRGFGTTIPGGPFKNIGEFRDKNVANTSVMSWGGKVYALWEGDRAKVLDPVTLDTLGEEDLQGVIPEGRPFSAHPHFCSNTGHLVCFGSGARSGNLWIWEIDEQCRVKVSKEFKFPAPPPYVHDFIVTPNYYIFYAAPLTINPAGLVGYLAGLSGQAKMAQFNRADKGKWYLLPRKSARPPIVIETPPAFVWHYANAFETENGDVVVDACTYEEFNLGEFDMLKPSTIPRGILMRHTISPSAQTAKSETLTQWSGDFPRVYDAFQGRDARYIYMAAVGSLERTFPFQSVVKYDTHTRTVDSYVAPDNHFVGEALFFPSTSLRGLAPSEISKEREDEGYVVTLEYNGDTHRSDLIILNARDLNAGPIARLKLKAHLPFAFHNGAADTAYMPSI